MIRRRGDYIEINYYIKIPSWLNRFVGYFTVWETREVRISQPIRTLITKIWYYITTKLLDYNWQTRRPYMVVDNKVVPLKPFHGYILEISENEAFGRKWWKRIKHITTY